jgi:hypothetical protein
MIRMIISEKEINNDNTDKEINSSVIITVYRQSNKFRKI